MQSWMLTRKSSSLGQDSLSIAHHSNLYSLDVYLFGATVVSWCHDGKEKLFTSEKAILDGSKPIRGGIPVVFPQFGQPCKEMPAHGIARTAKWIQHSFIEENDNATLILKLEDSPSTHSLWPHKFILLYSLKISITGLECSLEITNTDSTPFDFHALFHTYFKISNISDVCITGIQGHSFVDKVLNGTLIAEEIEDPLTIHQEVDRIYLNSPQSLPGIVLNTSTESTMIITKYATIKSPTDDTSSTPTASTNINVDVVVWNPWIDKSTSIADLGPEAYPNFVCVEPGCVSDWVTLPIGHTFRMVQILTPST
eukprot:gene803-1564_t